MIRQGVVSYRRADLETAAGNGLDLVERQLIDVDDARRVFDIQFHQVDECRSAGDESDIRALLIRAEGPNFSQGGDILDFIDKQLGKANPYGVYDVGTNTGWVSVGTDHDTAAFAVNTIRTWLRDAGMILHPKATRLLISPDGGSSNGYRTRQWKTELAALAADTGI